MMTKKAIATIVKDDKVVRRQIPEKSNIATIFHPIILKVKK